jgi:CheY-like chemotaxis protein
MLLKRLGYIADAVANGVEVLQALESKHYDLILLDVKKWAAHESDRPRIVAMTGNAMLGDCERCLAAGMDDYISKPIRLEELVMVLEAAGTRSRESPTAPRSAHRVSLWGEDQPQRVNGAAFYIMRAPRNRRSRSVAARAANRNQ